ncbi:6-bladed beta-propeller [bacterium]|nr:6-bladed beta-propeller [bacterium]
MAVDNNGNVYVADEANNRIKKFTSTGEFIVQWGTEGEGAGEFHSPSDVDVDSLGNVYVTDDQNHRIQKFDSNGNYLIQWGSRGEGPGEFHRPKGIGVGPEDKIYVFDSVNDRIQKFTSGGVFIAEWQIRETNGCCGSPVSDLGLDVDNYGNVFVTETFYNQRIWKYSQDGTLLDQWKSEDSEGWPSGIAVADDGRVYVTETGGGNRVKVYKKIFLNTANKAIIVAGGGPFAGNNLWSATQMSANFAYRALTHQGFNKQIIYYLTSDTDLDLDNNGEMDDVDGDATNSNLHYAITSWAGDAEKLFIYLVDHGGDNIFRTSGSETLSASELDSWLDELQSATSAKVVVVYDGCESGSFLSSLTPPPGKERVVITSTSPGESAYFVTQGSVSFSNFFWTHVFTGINVKDAFELTRQAIGYAIGFQNPLLDANGNGISNEGADFTLMQDTYIGNGTQINSSAPEIRTISPAQAISDVSSALLFADNVTDNSDIARVWAVIRPPDYSQGSTDNPVQDLPFIDLLPVGGDRYEGTFDGFNIEGTYHIAIYARDKIGNTAIPKLTTVSVENPLTRKAVILVGGPANGPLWAALENSATLAYEALKFQGYTDADIYFMSPETFSAGVDAQPSLNNLTNALNTWAPPNTQDVVLYLIGDGGAGTFQINLSETLSPAYFDGLLDSLQNTIPGRVTVVYDACQSGSFIPHLQAPDGKDRIVLTSAGNNQPACFLFNGEVSFSKYFWTRVLNGTNLRDAFLHAKQAIEYSTGGFDVGEIIARLDDNGNGIGNDKHDGHVARNYTIGAGVILAGDDPLIGSISEQQTVSEGGSATIWVDDATTTGNIASVWAVITPPGYNTGSASDPVIDMPTVELTAAGGNRYEGTFSDFASFGTYKVSVYAMDTEGAISLPMETTVCHVNCSDNYEDDDTYEQATVIVISDETPQVHNFHDDGDQDWVKFYGVSGQTYTIEVKNAQANCDAVIGLYDTDGVSHLITRDDTGAGEDEELAWPCPQDGIYYARIYNYETNVFGDDTGYELKVYRPTGPIAGFVSGVITDKQSAETLSDVRIKTNSNQSALSVSSGSYLLVHPPGTVTVTAQRDGYSTEIIAGVQISEGGITSLDIGLTPASGDTDGDGILGVVENTVDCLDADDDDSDDDGILDGNEDIDQDSELDPGETDPCDKDTDDDGLLDGTEIGLTAPQGGDTDLAVFIADADPTTTTDPLNNDTDDDGWLDGEEDTNFNGSVDAGEKDPNIFNGKALPCVPLLLLYD